MSTWRTSALVTITIVYAISTTVSLVTITIVYTVSPVWVGWIAPVCPLNRQRVDLLDRGL